MMDTTEDTDEETFAAEDDPHSLPTADELKTQHAIAAADAAGEGSGESTGRGGRNRKLAICVALLCVVALIVSLSVYFGTKTGGSNEPVGNQLLPPEQRFSISMDYVKTLNIEGTFNAVEDEDSPQFKALVWLARDDPLKLSIPELKDDGTYDETSAKEFLNRYVMSVLFFATNGADWTNNFGFMSEKPTCEWATVFQNTAGTKFVLGASCDSDGNINSLWLPSNKLDGDLPFEEISQLTSLTFLAFEFNENLLGSLPASIGDLSSLETLALSNNQFSEELPDTMATMTSLKYVMLDDNLLSGKVTPILNLPNLEIVYLEDNFFDGEINDSFFSNSNNLVHLDVSDNDFDGQVPVHLFQLPNLEVLDMHGNVFIDGEIPEIPTVQTKLQVLALHENLLSGEIPKTISNFPNLKHLDLSNNELSGEIPDAVGDLIDLDYLFLGMNDYDDMAIPDFIQNLNKLTDLSLKESYLVGEIPDWIGNKLSQLRLLDLDGNKLEGNIPTSLSELSFLSFLLLNDNELTGNVPPELVNTNLELLLLDHNSLVGDLNYLCSASDSNPIDMIIADCGGDSPEVTCALDTCCHTCCSDLDDECNERPWIGNMDPIWELGYQRFFYSFDDINAWYPAFP